MHVQHRPIPTPREAKPNLLELANNEAEMPQLRKVSESAADRNASTADSQPGRGHFGRETCSEQSGIDGEVSGGINQPTEHRHQMGRHRGQIGIVERCCILAS